MGFTPDAANYWKAGLIYKRPGEDWTYAELIPVNGYNECVAFEGITPNTVILNGRDGGTNGYSKVKFTY